MVGIVKSVQHGEITIPAGSASATATIAAVNTSKSFRIYRGFRLNDASFDASEDSARVELTSGNTVTAYTNSANAGAARVVPYTIVELAANAVVSIQQGTLSMGGFVSQSEVTGIIAAVDTDYTIPICCGVTYGAAADNALPRIIATIEKVSSTSFKIKRGLATTNILTMSWAMVELNSAVVASLQEKEITIAISNTTKDESISTVSDADTLLFWGGARHSGAVSALTDPRRYPYVHRTSTTNLRATVGVSDTMETVTARVTAVEFVSGCLSSRQAGQPSIASGQTISNNTISAVVLGSSIVSWLGFTHDTSTTQAYCFATAGLSSTTNLRLERGNRPSEVTTGSYEVGEFFNGFDLSADGGTYTISGVAANLEKHSVLAAEAGAYLISGTDASLEKILLLNAEAGAYVISGQTADLFYDRVLSADSGVYAISGQDTDLLLAALINAEAGAYVISGQDTTLFTGFSLTAAGGAYIISGTDANLEKHSVISAESGSYTISGTDANLEKHSVLSAESGVYSISGEDANLEKGSLITAEAGVYNISGQDTDLLLDAVLSAESGAYSISGQDVGLFADWALSAEAGSYIISGQDTQLLSNFVLGAEAGSYSIVGHDINLFVTSAPVSAVGDKLGGGRKHHRRRVGRLRLEREDRWKPEVDWQEIERKRRQRLERIVASALRPEMDIAPEVLTEIESKLHRTPITPEYYELELLILAHYI